MPDARFGSSRSIARAIVLVAFLSTLALGLSWQAAPRAQAEPLVTSWSLEGSPLGEGQENATPVYGYGELSLSFASVHTGPCPVEMQGAFWNGAEVAEGQIESAALSGGCATNWGCTAQEVSPAGEGPWPLSATGSEVQIENVDVTVHYNAGCGLPPIRLTGILTGAFDNETGCVDVNSEGLELPAYSLSSTVEGEVCLEAEAGGLLSLSEEEVLPASAPQATTEAASWIDATDATLRATVNPERDATSYYFEYGKTTAYGTKIPVSPEEIGSGSAALEVSQRITGLAEGQIYHYRVVAANGAGTAEGADASLTTLKAPQATTEAASAVGADEATLNGTANPNGSATSYYFEYGKTTAYGAKIPTSAKALGSGTSNVAVAQAPTGLSQGTTYHYRLVAESQAATVHGADKTLTTPKVAEVATEAASSVEATQATLNAGVNPNGAATGYWFEYGKTTGYGSKAPSSAKEAGSGSSSVAVSQAITSLAEGQTYHYRAVAEREGVLRYGSDRTLTTLAVPTVSTEVAGSVKSSSATLGATINPNGSATSYYFEYGKTTAYGTKVPASPEGIGSGVWATGVSQTIGDLWANTTYHYRAVATNGIGTVHGADETLTTQPLREGAVSFWSLEGNPLAEGPESPTPFQGHGALSISFVGLQTGPCPVEMQGSLWNGTEAAEGQIESAALSGECPMSWGCSLQSVSPAGEGPWPLSASGPGVQLENVDLTLHYYGSCLPPLRLTGTLTGSFENETGCAVFEDSEGLELASYGYPTLIEGEVCLEAEGGALFSLSEEPAPLPPVATTEAASPVNASEAAMKATVDPQGLATDYYFEYGKTTAYGAKIPVSPESVGSGTSPVEVSKTLTGLSEGDVLHYRVVAENSAGQTKGADKTLTVRYMPEATTTTATSVEANEATLHGTVDPNGSATEYQFEYGPTTAYGSLSAPEEAGDEEEAIEAGGAVAHLKPEATYHYRIVATSPAGTDVGADKALTTGAAVMSVKEEEEHEAEELHYTGKLDGGAPNDFFGMMTTGESDQMARPNILNAVKYSGAKMLRLPMYPACFEEGKEGSEALNEKVFRQASHRGITILPAIGSGAWPTGTSKLRGCGQSEWEGFAKKIVEKYGPGGSFWSGVSGTHHPPHTWEIWNEPNMGSNSSTGSIDASGFGEFFAAMSSEAKAGAKARGQSIEVLLSGLWGYSASSCGNGTCQSIADFITKMGHAGSYNAVNIHPYVFSGNVTTVKEKVRKDIKEAHDVSGKPVWITEIGWPTKSSGDSVPVVSNEKQAELIEKVFSMIEGVRTQFDVAHVFYYNLQDDEKDEPKHNGWAYRCGLRTADGHNRPAWRAFAEVAGGAPSWPHKQKPTHQHVAPRPNKLSLSLDFTPEGQEAMVRLEWGSGPISSSYPNQTSWQSYGAAEEGQGEGMGEEEEVEVNSEITGLSPEHPYHYRVVTISEDGEKEVGSGEEFTTPPSTVTKASVERTLNGEPGWATVGGSVNEGGGAGLSSVYVNVNFQKKVGPGPEEWETVEARTAHPTVTGGSFQAPNVPYLGKGTWRTRAVFPPQAGYQESKSEYTEPFVIKNGYHLVAKHSGKCLEVSYGSSEDGTPIHQEPCGDGHTAQAQTFVLVPSPSNPGQYQIVNRKSGKCLDVVGASQENGAPIDQYGCVGWGGTNEVFEGGLTSYPGYVTYAALHSGKCLDVVGGSSADGALLDQWSCNGSAHQAFGFESVEADPVPTTTHLTHDQILYGHPGYETLHGSVDTPQSVAGQKVFINFKKWNGSKYVYEGNQGEATLNSEGNYNLIYHGVGAGDWEMIAIYPGSGSLAESRTSEGAHTFHVGDGYRFVFRNSGKCLSTSGGGIANGTAILQWTCSGSPSPADGQVYSIVPVDNVGENHFQIQPDSVTAQEKAEGKAKCLDVTSVSSENGAKLQLWTCLGASQRNQVWHSVGLGGANEGWFAWLPQNTTSKNMCMDVTAASGSNGALIEQWECHWGGNQQWAWQPIG